MKAKEELISKINTRTVVVGIIGLGYVGLPLALRYAEVGTKVIGLDIDSNLVEQTNSGISLIDHISSSSIEDAVKKGLLEATTEYSCMNKCDALILCVPTPLNNHREPDLSYVISTIESLLPHIRSGQILSLESTTYPGTTEEEIVTRVESNGLKVGEEFFVVYSPEREDPGNTKYDTSSIPKVVGGHSINCAEVGKKLYELAIERIVEVSSTKSAELTKLLENIHRAVNIGLVNEMKIVADKMDIDIFEVIDAAATKPFGFTPYYPGPGLGGHCIPIDPFYLTWKAREYGVNTKFIELSGEINESMPKYVVDKFSDALNLCGKALSNSKVLILGIAYKKNVGDMRESPSVKIMDLLVSSGVEVKYSDPYVPEFPQMREYTFKMKSLQLSKENIQEFDAVILLTDHDQFDYDLIEKSAELIIDARGRYRHIKNNKVIQA